MTGIITVAPKTAVVDTVQGVYDAFEDAKYDTVVVRAGTYDFNTISVTDLTIYSNRRYSFLGEVIFKNVRIQTETHKNDDVYEDGSSHIAWDGSTDFDKTAGANWPTMDTDWKIHARDGWFDVASSTTTSINPAKDFLGTLSGLKGYALCKPTINVYAEGYLRLIIDDSPGPFASNGGFVHFAGLAYADMGRLHLHVTRESDTALTVFTGTWQPVVIFRSCAECLLPGVTVSDLLFEPTSNAGLFTSVATWRNYHCKWSHIRVGNIEMNTSYDNWLVGFAAWNARGCDFGQIVISGLSRNGGGATHHCVGIDADNGTIDNVLRGRIGGLSCSSGDVYYINDYAGGAVLSSNIIDIGITDEIY